MNRKDENENRRMIAISMGNLAGLPLFGLLSGDASPVLLNTSEKSLAQSSLS
jgi:hypothetical protein